MAARRASAHHQEDTVDGDNKNKVGSIDRGKEDPFEQMQERLRKLGHETMLLQPWTTNEIQKLCAVIDARWKANETNLDIAMRKREERRQKKRDRRGVDAGPCCLIVPDQRRTDRRCKRFF